MSGLSETQLRYLANAWKCFESEPKIDYDKFATLSGLKSAASAREMLRVTKKKLMENASVSASTGTSTKAGNAPKAGNASKRVVKAKKAVEATKKRGRVVGFSTPVLAPASGLVAGGYTDNDNDNDDEGEEDDEEARPSKKPKPSIQAQVKNEPQDDDGQDDNSDSGYGRRSFDATPSGYDIGEDGYDFDDEV